MNNTKQDRFLHLLEPVHDSFVRFCRARVYGLMDYRDLMNESLLVAYEKLDDLKNESAFFSFLCGISIRLLSNQNRKIQESSLEREHHVYQDHSFDGEMHTDVHFLHEALAQLNTEQRECIVLFEIAGFSIKEISYLQEASESAVKQRLKRGRERLTALMTYDEITERKEDHHG